MVNPKPRRRTLPRTQSILHNSLEPTATLWRTRGLLPGQDVELRAHCLYSLFPPQPGYRTSLLGAGWVPVKISGRTPTDP